MLFDSVLEQDAYEKIIDAGWQPQGILYSPIIPTENQISRPDFILLYNLYPLAVVEVKGALAHGEGQQERILNLAHTLSIPFALVIAPDAIAVSSSSQNTTFSTIPSPRELWEGLGRVWNPNDPRIFPPAIEGDNKQPKWFQAFAISRVIDAVIEEKNPIPIVMAQGSGSTYVTIQIAWKLLRSGFKSRILYVDSLKMPLEQASQQFKSVGFHIERPKKSASGASGEIHFTLLSDIMSQNPTDGPLAASPDFYDLLFVRNNSVLSWQTLAEHFPKTQLIALLQTTSGRASITLGKPTFEFTFDDAVSFGLFQDYTTPPDGFRSVRLKDIAEILVAPRVLPQLKSSEPAKQSVLQISARDISRSGVLDVTNIRRVEAPMLNVSQDRLERLLVRSEDILLGTFYLSSGVPVALVKALPDEPATFANSLFLIRVRSEIARPSDVFDFLISNRGQKLLNLLASSSGTIRRISRTTLEEIPIFLPESAAVRKTTAESLGVIAKAISQLSTDILFDMEKIRNIPYEESGEQRRLVAARLVEVARSIAPFELAEQVITEYPMPIALAYRRFLDARFDSYQQVFRLRDVFEAIAFFVYNVLLCDWLGRLDPIRYFISNSGARLAFNSFSISTRVDFVSEILRIAGKDAETELFMPELLNTSFVPTIDTLQSEFRNRISHIGLQSEGRQKDILERFQPMVDQLLGELQFISTYRLARVVSIYKSGHELFRHVETYRGTAREISRERFDPKFASQIPDHQHLVLFDSEDNVLDLYPFYQLFANEDTRKDSHLCVFKQSKPTKRILEGESVEGLFEGQYVKCCVKSRSRVGSALVLHFDPIEAHAANHGIEH